MAQSKSIKRWIDRINSSPNSDSVVTDALLKIRPYSKRKTGIRDIKHHGGIECLLMLIQRPNKRVLDVAISVLANCSTEDAVCKEVFECKGIPLIVKLMQTIKCHTILTRSCRSIANLASDIECSKTIHVIGAPKLIIKLIKQPRTPTECVASALRALKNLANTPGHRRKLLQHGVVPAITKCFDSDSKDILRSSLCTLAAVSQLCTLEFADHMLGNDGDPTKRLVKIIEENTTLETASKNSALAVIINLTLQGCTRPTIGSVGGLKCIVNEIKTTIGSQTDLTPNSDTVYGPLQENAFSLVGALCYCCREAINRAKLRSMDALPILIQLLSDNRWIPIHPFILTTMLCFVYDEEGLKILHENGIFTVLLEKLQKYMGEEKNDLKDDKSKEAVWDGNDSDSADKFDKRHSLSYDVPSRFNLRPQLEETTTDIEATFNDLRKFEFDWKTHESSIPYSPQWSPVGPSPVPDELAFATESALSQSDLHPGDSHHAIEDDDILVVATCPLLDQDDSSSSREGFDQMHSPALLPVTGPFINKAEEAPNIGKRDRVTSSSSSESETPRIRNNEIGEEFTMRMEMDLQQVPKRAKVDNLKDDGDRIRSRSLDNAANNGRADKLNLASSHAGPSSPTPEFTLPDLGSTACSPSFLQFVNDTCSVSPLVLKHAGRESGSFATSSTSASLWKQTRRRRISGATKKPDEFEVGGDLTAEQSVVQLQHTNPMPSEDKAPGLKKSTSNPFPISKDEVSCIDHAKDCALSGPEPVTPVQVILCLLCHYCEMSDIYVVSLAQQEYCTSSFVNYVTDSSRNLDTKFYRIIDRLTSCPECFKRIVTAFLVPCITAAANLRMISRADQSGVSCIHCYMKISSGRTFPLGSMWHNISLTHSSVYGTSTLKALLKAGTNAEAVSSACIILLLSLWCRDCDERMKSMSDSFLKHLISNLQFMVHENKIQFLCEAIHKNDSTSNIFKCASYTFHKLAAIGDMPIDGTLVEQGDPDIYDDLEINEQHDENLLTLFASKHLGDFRQICEYDKCCNTVEPDKILVLPMEFGEAYSARRKKRSRRKKLPAKSIGQDAYLPIHVDVLSAKSPMFEAMLGGKYREFSEKEVAIQDIPYKTALYIIHGMYGCTDEDCPEMKGIISEISDPHTSRYQMFRDADNHATAPKNCPPEVDILRVMDLWLLQDSRLAFYEKYRSFFGKCYIEAEISLLGKGAKAQSDSHCEDIISNCSSEKDSKCVPDADTPSTSVVSIGTPHQLSSNCPFLIYAVNHGFLDVTHDYITSFLSPCLYDHNYMLQGKVLSSVYSSLDDHDSSRNLIACRISKILESILNEFKAVRKPG